MDRKNKYFKLQIGSKLDNVSVDRLKPVSSDDKVSPALPLTRGRPPRCLLPPASKPLPPVSNLPPFLPSVLSESTPSCDAAKKVLLLPSSDAPSGEEYCSGQDFFDDIYSVPVSLQTKDVSV